MGLLCRRSLPLSLEDDEAGDSGEVKGTGVAPPSANEPSASRRLSLSDEIMSPDREAIRSSKLIDPYAVVLNHESDNDAPPKSASCNSLDWYLMVNKSCTANLHRAEITTSRCDSLIFVLKGDQKGVKVLM